MLDRDPGQSLALRRINHYLTIIMPKVKDKLPRGGVSQRVRQTTFLHPSQQHLYSDPSESPRTTSRQRNIRNEKITSDLGPQAREAEIQKSDAMMKETLQSKLFHLSPMTISHSFFKYMHLDMDLTTRQLLQDIQTQAGVVTMDEAYAIEDYNTTFDNPYEEDDAWFDNDDIAPPAETLNIIAAAHDLRHYL